MLGGRLLSMPATNRRRIWLVLSAIWVLVVNGLVHLRWIDGWATTRNSFLYRTNWWDQMMADSMLSTPMYLCIGGTIVLALITLGVPWAMSASASKVPREGDGRVP